MFELNYVDGFSNRHGKAKSWEQLPWVIKQWKELSGGKPFVLKGIQSGESSSSSHERESNPL